MNIMKSRRLYAKDLTAAFRSHNGFAFKEVGMGALVDYLAEVVPKKAARMTGAAPWIVLEWELSCLKGMGGIYGPIGQTL